MDINEIARRASVSRATVSRYLNNGYVSKEKRERIRRIIEQTGYVPSQQARQLRTGKTGLVGVVIPKINSQSVSRMVAGIADGLSERGYRIVLVTTNNDTNLELDALRLFSNKTQVDGIVLIATVLTEEHRHVTGALPFPVVVLGQDFEGFPCVYQADYQAMFDLTRLAAPSARHAAYLGVLQQDEAAGRMRRQGFLDGCAEAGLVVSDRALRIVGFDADSAYFGTERLLEDLPDTDTILCATDEIAFGAMMCLHEYGRDVPGDVQVAGIGDSLLARIARPSLTTAHLHYKTAGYEAASMLFDLMGQGKAAPSAPPRIKMPYEVYARNSTR